MPTPSSGQMRLRDDIAASSLGSSFSGALTTNVGMNNFVRGGTYIPNIAAGNNQSTTPTSTSNMSFNNYYSVWGYRRLSFNMTNAKGVWNDGKSNWTYAGYTAQGGTGQSPPQNPFLSGGMPNPSGSISSNTFTTPNGVHTIVALYFTESGSYFDNGALVLHRSGAAPTNTDFSFISGFNGMGSTSFLRTTGTNSNAFSNWRQWGPSNKTAFGAFAASTNGTVYSCYLNYYG
jgi:hypothetical protein